MRRIAVKLEMYLPYKRHAAIFAGLQQYAQKRRWYTIVDEYADDTLARCGGSVPYDGVIARATEKLVKVARRLQVPLVNVWISSPAWKRVPSVFADCLEIGRLRAEHLLSRGLRQFAALTSDNDRGQVDEIRAFTDVIRQAGGTAAAVRVPLNAMSSVQVWRQTEKTLAEWMDGWKLPIGVYVGAESHARIVAQACHNRGWRVPDDVAIIAGENEVTHCQGLRPTLSTVEVGYERIGYEAARLLERLMNGESPPTEPTLIPPQGLVVRESTDFFAVEDALIAAALKFIAANSHLDINHADVARAVELEPRTLQRRFQKYLLRPVADEICRVRIERAKRELVQGQRTLQEIASAVGFGDAKRMYDAFRRELGVTPSQYRQADRADTARL